MRDATTGLPTRAFLVESLDGALGRAGRLDTSVAAVAVELDGFTTTWEQLGHRAAEELVVTAAGRLGAATRPGDVVARTGVDEFTLLLEGFREDEAAELARRAVAGFSTPLVLGGRRVQVGAVAGVAVHPARSAPTRAEELLHRAGVAVGLARADGAGSVRVFEESMRAGDDRPPELRLELASAVRDGQVRAVYQPVVRLGTLEVVGFESLARWHHPVRGPVPPASFIPLAEDTGDIVELGRFVLATACRQMAAWMTQHPGPTLQIGVNISPRQLAAGGFVDDVRAALADAGLPGHQLVLEVTESALPHDLASVQQTLQQLRDLGVHIAMDDFGTGFSSLAHLSRLPIDILKIDRSFIDDPSPSGARLLAAVIDIGSRLGLDTVAEGIERTDQLEAARAAGCTFGQGYLIARPLEAHDAEVLVAARTAREQD